MENNIYYLVGKIIENVQDIEYNLIEGTKIARILNVFERHKKVSPTYFHKIEMDTKRLVDEMVNMTFGQLMGIVRQNEFLSSDDMDYLESLLSKRNQLVHQYFKYNEMNQASEEVKTKYLLHFLEEAQAFKKYLNDVILELKKDLKNIIYK